MEGDHQSYTAPTLRKLYRRDENLSNLDDKYCLNTNCAEGKNNDETLIAMVRPQSHLYDKGHLWYHNCEAKAETWAKIGKRMGIDPQQCENRWLTLRGHFVRERKIYEKETSSPGDTNRIPWDLYESMLFMDKFIPRRRRNTTIFTKKTVATDSKRQKVVDSSYESIDSQDITCGAFLDIDSSSVPPHQTECSPLQTNPKSTRSLHMASCSSSPKSEMSVPYSRSIPKASLTLSPSRLRHRKSVDSVIFQHEPLDDRSSTCELSPNSPETQDDLSPVSSTAENNAFEGFLKFSSNPSKVSSMEMSTDDIIAQGIRDLTCNTARIVNYLISKDLRQSMLPKNDSSPRDEAFLLGELVKIKIRETPEPKKSEFIAKVLDLLKFK